MSRRPSTRYAWHRPPWKYDLTEGVRAYQPSKTAENSGEARAIRAAFPPGEVEKHGIVWLALDHGEQADWTWRSYAQVRIDMSALDPAKLRYSYGAEGYWWHLGNIPAAAIRDSDLPTNDND